MSPWPRRSLTSSATRARSCSVRSSRSWESRRSSSWEALRRLFAAALRGGDEAQAGQALIDHVRFEERELFPVLETLFEEARP